MELQRLNRDLPDVTVTGFHDQSRFVVQIKTAQFTSGPPAIEFLQFQNIPFSEDVKRFLPPGAFLPSGRLFLRPRGRSPRNAPKAQAVPHDLHAPVRGIPPGRFKTAPSTGHVIVRGGLPLHRGGTPAAAARGYLKTGHSLACPVCTFRTNPTGCSRPHNTGEARRHGFYNSGPPTPSAIPTYAPATPCGDDKVKNAGSRSPRLLLWLRPFGYPHQPASGRPILRDQNLAVNRLCIQSGRSAEYCLIALKSDMRRCIQNDLLPIPE